MTETSSSESGHTLSRRRFVRTLGACAGTVTLSPVSAAKTMSRRANCDRYGMEDLWRRGRREHGVYFHVVTLSAVSVQP